MSVAGPCSTDYSHIKAALSNTGPQGKYHLVLTIQPQVASRSSAQHTSWMGSGAASTNGTFFVASAAKVLMYYGLGNFCNPERTS